MTQTSKTKNKRVKLNRYERAILVLARHVESNPYNRYEVEEQVMGELGYVSLPTKLKRKGCLKGGKGVK